MKNKAPYSYESPHFKKDGSETIFTICGMTGLLSTNDRRTFGWYAKLNGALDAVVKNKCDLHECYYQYVVIEEVKEGVFGMAIKEWWFKWNKNKRNFFSIQKPKETNRLVSWGIG